MATAGPSNRYGVGVTEGEVAVEPSGGEGGGPATRRLVPPHVLAPALAALVCLVLVIVDWQVFVGTTRGQLVEEAARIGSKGARDHFAGVTGPMLDVVSVPSLVIVLGVAVLIALAQRRWSIAVAAIVVLAGANVTTQILQELLERPIEDSSPIALNSFPSGHATVAASVAATALLVLPVRWRPPVAVLGALLAGALGISTMIGNEVGAWHRGSDVVAALLIAAMWYFVVEAVLAGLAQANGESCAGGNPPRALVKIPLRILTALGWLCVGLGGGALAATAVQAPITSDIGHQVAFLGSVFGVAAVSFFTHALMLRLRPHHPTPAAEVR